MKSYKLSFILVALAALANTSASKINRELSLNTDNFDDFTKEGLSFIQFTSPYCGHCKRLAPTWTELVDITSESSQLSNVRLAKVNCASYGEFCNKNEVMGYPTMLLYENGRMVDEFHGPRKLDLLMEFLESHVRRYYYGVLEGEGVDDHVEKEEEADLGAEGSQVLRVQGSK